LPGRVQEFGAFRRLAAKRAGIRRQKNNKADEKVNQGKDDDF
jgi:hypothetical protein